MRRASRRGVSCPSEVCAALGRASVAPHGYSKTRWGRRRRYRCTACGRTFGATAGTAYARLQHSTSKFDRVVALSVEGMSKAAIARVERLSWSTVARWLERAAEAARRFNASRTRGFVLRELQLDEMRAFVESKKRVSWVFAAIEVWSRLWPATVVGSRTYRNTRRFVSAAMHEGHPTERPLITTDGFKYYAPVLRRLVGPACILGQVIKRVRKDRVVTVGRKLVIGSTWKLEDALARSEDSTKLNTSFIERLNLTIRRGCAFLARKTPAHARRRRTLEEQLELFRCYYNFIRPHGALRFGREVRTPAMQAGLAKKRLRFRDVFTYRGRPLRFTLVGSRLWGFDGGDQLLRRAA